MPSKVENQGEVQARGCAVAHLGTPNCRDPDGTPEVLSPPRFGRTPSPIYTGLLYYRQINKPNMTQNETSQPLGWATDLEGKSDGTRLGHEVK